jgi:hypothetical protein
MIVIDKWAGLVTNASPYSLPPGAAVTQVNLQCLVPGMLNVRGGMSAITWTSHTGSSIPVIAMARVQAGTLETVVYQNASGDIFAARGPS